ncbi:MAG: hypothetical protein BWX98_01632 [Candidatus Aminicenantes bacterium ADurb.Bin147]|nr:MAG: hypothetical protein BWX98_01632 [Candidatus Aminicenantes bacterium ADurb.Bin147]
MSKLRFPSAATWTEFHLRTKLLSPPVIKLKIKPVYKRDLAQIVYGKANGRSVLLSDETLYEMFDRQAALAAQLVEDWDLCLPGSEVPIACNDDNKSQFLNALLWEDLDLEAAGAEDKPDEDGDESIELGGDKPVKDKKKKSPRWLFGGIIDFANNPENYLKN